MLGIGSDVRSRSVKTGEEKDMERNFPFLTPENNNSRILEVLSDFPWRTWVALGVSGNGKVQR